MELINQNMDKEAYHKYSRAQKKVKEIKGFHSHLRTFIIISLVVVIGNFLMLNFADFVKQDEGFGNWLLWNAISVPIIWGIVILIHWFYVFRSKKGFFKDWEERKISEIIEKEEEELKRRGE